MEQQHQEVAERVQRVGERVRAAEYRADAALAVTQQGEEARALAQPRRKLNDMIKDEAGRPLEKSEQ